MSCNTGKLTTKKKIILFSSIGVGIAIATYLAFTTTNNPAIAAALPTVFAFAACPIMCAAMGGVMWFSRRLSKNKNNDIQVSPAKEISCCGVSQENSKQQKRPKLKLEDNIEVVKNNKENSISIPQEKRKIYEN